MANWRQGSKNPHNIYRNDRPAAFATEPLFAQELVLATQCCCRHSHASAPSPAALQALAELEHVANLSLPDDATVTLQVGFLRPRLAAIRAVLR